MPRDSRAGLGLFFVLHLFHRIDIALISAFQVASLMRTDIFLCDVGQYLLPVVLLLGHAARELQGNKCPYPSRQPGYPKVLASSKRPA